MKIEELFNPVIPGLGHVEVSRERPLPAHLRDLLEADDRQRFWLAPERWPRDVMGMVFLARAVQLLGQTLFPNEWHGFEPSVDLSLAPLPILPELAPASEGRKARKLVDRRWVIDHSLWRQLREKREQTLSSIAGSRKRLVVVRERLIEAFLSGELPYAVRNDNRGDFSDTLPAHWWNTELTDARFYWCRINIRNPISHAVGGDGFQFIYIAQRDLTTLIDKLGHPAPKEKNTLDDVHKLEGYLRAAIKASPNKRTLDFKKDIQPWMRANAPSITDRMYRDTRKSILDVQTE
ncbi:hypothetical protein [uncultured Pelagibacterium sp.]|uniref:hypothetical protein n=1 Tax=uncultured Pelagibacterium sp. TaxID=1159875 RepID=UPI0030D72B50|tara:strand:- start:37 stop:912 length:876 start_codon:yes stop_codon:yes gene_type:complete